MCGAVRGGENACIFGDSDRDDREECWRFRRELLLCGEEITGGDALRCFLRTKKRLSRTSICKFCFDKVLFGGHGSRWSGYAFKRTVWGFFGDFCGRGDRFVPWTVKRAKSGLNSV